MLLVPLFHIRFSQVVRKTEGVITGRRILSRLRVVSNGELRHFQNSLRALEAVHLGRLASQIQAEIYGDLSVLI